MFHCGVMTQLYVLSDQLLLMFVNGCSESWSVPPGGGLDRDSWCTTIRNVRLSKEKTSWVDVVHLSKYGGEIRGYNICLHFLMSLFCILGHFPQTLLTVQNISWHISTFLPVMTTSCQELLQSSFSVEALRFLGILAEWLISAAQRQPHGDKKIQTATDVLLCCCSRWAAPLVL